MRLPGDSAVDFIRLFIAVISGIAEDSYFASYEETTFRPPATSVIVATASNGKPTRMGNTAIRVIA